MKNTILLLLLTIPILVNAQFKKEADKDTTRKVRYAAIPILNYNNTFDFMLGAMVAGYYKLNAKDTISPSSSTMVMGMYSTSKTYMAMAFQQLYFNEDNWRIKAGMGTGEIFFQTFQDLPNFGGGYWNEDGIWVEYSTNMIFALSKIQRQTFPDLYVGVEALYSFSTTEFDITHPITGEKPTSDANMNSIGYNLAYDTRDHVNFPTQGYFINYKNNFVREWLGSSDNFNQFELVFNHFWDINNNKKSILVSRFFTDIATGDVPFQGENFIGRDDLRGYSQGKYRGKQVYAIQAELRQNIYKKFGMIGFLGVGTAANEFNEIFENDILPSVGLGVRYLMIPKEKINIGIDVGVGKDDWSLAFRIGETFGR